MIAMKIIVVTIILFAMIGVCVYLSNVFDNFKKMIEDDEK